MPHNFGTEEGGPNVRKTDVINAGWWEEKQCDHAMDLTAEVLIFLRNPPPSPSYLGTYIVPTYIHLPSLGRKKPSICLECY